MDIRKALGLIGVVLACLITPVVAEETKPTAVETFGVKGFRRDFFRTLTVTPHSQDKTIKEGHSRITYTGRKTVFDESWVNDGVEFVAYRIHKNEPEITKEAFFPSIKGSRYAKVVEVLDGKNLIVDFVYNGGDTKTPQVSKKVSGYFFIDCSDALRRMVQAPDRPGVFVFESGRTYVCKGMPNIPFHARTQKGDMRWISSKKGSCATIKFSAEDAINIQELGNTVIRGQKSEIPVGAFFMLDRHDYSIYVDGLDFIGPTYSVPMVMTGGWTGTMFQYRHGECERTLEIRNCNTLAEKRAYKRGGIRLPEGANWVAPSIASLIGGGGKRGDRGDGVVDVIGYQRFNLIRSTWMSPTVFSVKNNDGAGNWITIDGVDTDRDGKPVNRVYVASFRKKINYENVKLSFHDFRDHGARRGVRVESDDFSMLMMSNVYWNGGLSMGVRESVYLVVDGFQLYFGNNGDWRREHPNKALNGLLNSQAAMLFDRIPVVADEIPVAKVGGSYRIWGWGVQVGDVLEVNGRSYEVAGRNRKAASGTIHGLPETTGHFAHFWDVSFKGGGPGDNRFTAKVAKSRTAYLLDGKPRVTRVFYGRRGRFVESIGDMHWQYNRAEVNYEFRNIYFNSGLRQSGGPADNRSYQGIWEFPVKQEWVNAWAMDSDGSVKGEAAREQRSEAFGNSLQRRNRHKDAKKMDHHILVDGGRLFARRPTERHSPVWIRNRPELIYGTGSFGEPRLCNPVMLDKKGVSCPVTGLSISLVGGYTLDLSNSRLGERANSIVVLRVFGNGTLILNDVEFRGVKGGERIARGYLQTRLANGLQKDVFKLSIRGRNGSSSVHLVDKPSDGSVKLSGWRMPGKPEISGGWRAISGFNEKININGKSGAEITN